MKTRIGAYEAKTRLPELLREVRAGYTFTITKHGKPVAVLAPESERPARDKAAAVTALKAMMRDEPVTGVDVRKLIDHGRA